MANRTYDLAYWINEREAIRTRKESGIPAPWTNDPHMATVRYCNVRREDDKVTRYIRSKETYSNPQVATWRVVLARMVNRIPTLTELIPAVEDGDMVAIKDVLKHLRQHGPIWGNAYTISTCGKAMDKVDYVVDHVVQSVQMQDWDSDYAPTCKAMFDKLTSIDGLGSFLAAQVVADLKNIKGHPLENAPDWWTWSAHGPGSLKGLTAYFGKTITPRFYQEAIECCYDEVKPFLANYVPTLHMQDFQNCLCEFSKYVRVKEGGHARNSYVAG